MQMNKEYIAKIPRENIEKRLYELWDLMEADEHPPAVAKKIREEADQWEAELLRRNPIWPL